MATFQAGPPQNIFRQQWGKVNSGRSEHLAAIMLEATIVVECLWRLLESGRIRFTSEDDGQQFGLPVPVDAAAEVNERLARATVVGVDLREGLLDLELRFSTGHALQIVPDSSGYEAWKVSSVNAQFIAVGGGELVIFGSSASHG